MGLLSTVTKFVPLHWLLIGGLGISVAGSAWAAHSWTKASWKAHHENYKLRAFEQVVDAVNTEHQFWQERMADREAVLEKYQARLREVRGDLEEARGETRIVYREIPVTDAGECQFTADGVQLLERAAAAANRAAGLDAASGAADGGNGERAALSGATGGSGPT